MRKIPMRRCVVTQQSMPKQDLVRVVLTPEGDVELDLSGRKNGRGAYVSKDIEVIEQAMKNGALNKALKVRVPDEVYEALKVYVSK
jgi:uncharacterized protein